MGPAVYTIDIFEPSEGKTLTYAVTSYVGEKRCDSWVRSESGE